MRAHDAIGLRHFQADETIRLMSKCVRGFRVFAAICCVNALWLPRGTTEEATRGLTAAILAAAADGAEKEQAKTPEAVPQTRAADVRCTYLITVAGDFIIAAYKNGESIPETKRELLLDRSGATVEKIEVSVRTGDWLVFNVAHNPVRPGGSRYFAAAGCFAPNEFGFVSDPASPKWSVCDDPLKARDFIRRRDAGRNMPALSLEKP